MYTEIECPYCGNTNNILEYKGGHVLCGCDNENGCGRILYYGCKSDNMKDRQCNG